MSKTFQRDLLDCCQNAVWNLEHEQIIATSELLRFAREQSLLPMLYPALQCEVLLASEQKKAYIVEAMGKNAIRSLKFDQALREITRLFLDESIAILPYKGASTKYYYPDPDLRTMGDIDLIIDTTSHETIEEILSNTPFSLSQRSKTGLVYTYEGLLLELSLSTVLHEMLPNIAWCNSATSDQRGKDSATCTQCGNASGSCDKSVFASADLDSRFLNQSPRGYFTFSPACEFALCIQHIAQHTRGYGAGVRMVLDAAVLWESMDARDQVEALDTVATTGLTQFCRYVGVLADVWFGCGWTAKSGAELDSAATAWLSDTILDHGTFGHADRSDLAYWVEADAGRLGWYERAETEDLQGCQGRSLKTAYFKAHAWPSREKLEHLYPQLKEKPYLKNWYRIKRLFQWILTNPMRAVIRIKSVMNLNDEHVEGRARILKVLGITDG